MNVLKTSIMLLYVYDSIVSYFALMIIMKIVIQSGLMKISKIPEKF